MANDADLNCNDGTAALNICESLLLALTDLKVIRAKDVRALLTDVATANAGAATECVLNRPGFVGGSNS